MPTELTCPSCGTTARSAKEIAPGTQIRCPSCKVVFNFQPSAPVKPRASTAMRKEPAAVAPVREEPRSSPRRRDDDDDDRPRRKKKKKSSGAAIGIIIGAAVVGVLALVGIVVAVVVTRDSGTHGQVASNNNNATYLQPPPRGGQFDPPPRQSSNGANGAATTKQDPPSSDTSVVQSAPAGTGSVQDIYDYVLKSTVLIFNVMPNALASGTGSVVDVNERLILTNYHVVAGMEHLVVCFPIYEGGKPVAERESYMNKLQQRLKTPADFEASTEVVEAELIGTDSARDLALIRVPRLPKGTEMLPIAKTMVTIGQSVHSIGNPGASGALWIYTEGKVRAVYRHKWKIKLEEGLVALDSEVVETQSPTNHGDSGGPLCNDRGELVGVTEGGSSKGTLTSWFISLNEARDFIEKQYQRKFGKAWSPIARASLRIRGGGGGMDVTALINALDHKDAKTRASAARSLGEMGPDAKLAIRRLVKALKDTDDLTARASAEALTKIGAPSRDDLPALIDALKDSKPEVRRSVSGAIGLIGPDAASAAEKLVSALSDDDERVRENLVRSLGSLGSDAKAAAVPGLTKALEDSSKHVRVTAASALTILLTPPTAADVTLFVKILKQQDAEARIFGARALAKMGKQAKSALPDLMEAAKNPDAGVRREAIDSLATIGPDAKTAAPLYLAALKDGTDSAVRQSALHALGELGKDLDKDKDTISAVIDAAKDQDAQVRKAALAAVGKLGAVIGTQGAKQVMPAVIDALQGKDTTFREQALETIAGLGPLAREATTPLINMIEKHDIKLFVKEKGGKPFLQEADDAFLDKIAKTIGKIGLPAVKPLLRSLDTTNVSNFGLFIGSCRALGEVGPPAKEALLALATISRANLPPPVCDEADRAIRKIRK